MTDALDTEHRPLPDDTEVMTADGPRTVKWVREHDLSYWTDKLAYARANVAKYRLLLGLPDTDEEVREELVKALKRLVEVGTRLGNMFADSNEGPLFDKLSEAVAIGHTVLAKAKAQP